MRCHLCFAIASAMFLAMGCGTNSAGATRFGSSWTLQLFRAGTPHDVVFGKLANLQDLQSNLPSGPASAS